MPAPFAKESDMHGLQLVQEEEAVCAAGSRAGGMELPKPFGAQMIPSLCPNAYLTQRYEIWFSSDVFQSLPGLIIPLYDPSPSLGASYLPLFLQ